MILKFVVYVLLLSKILIYQYWAFLLSLSVNVYYSYCAFSVTKQEKKSCRSHVIALLYFKGKLEIACPQYHFPPHGIRHRIEFKYFSWYCIEVRYSSIVTTLICSSFAPHSLKMTLLQCTDPPISLLLLIVIPQLNWIKYGALFFPNKNLYTKIRDTHWGLFCVTYHQARDCCGTKY